MSKETERDELARDLGYAYGSIDGLVTPADASAADDLIAAGWTKPRTRTVVTGAELDDLLVGSVVRAHWPDGSHPDHQVMRCKDGGASSSGFAVASGAHWTGMATWGATLTVLWEPTK